MNDASEQAGALQGIFGTWMDAEAQKLRDPAPRTLGRDLARRDMMDIYVAEWNRLRRQANAHA